MPTANARLSTLTPDSRKALDDASERLMGLDFDGCLARATTTAWRPSSRTPDGALLRVSLELLGV